MSRPLRNEVVNIDASTLDYISTQLLEFMLNHEDIVFFLEERGPHRWPAPLFRNLRGHAALTLLCSDPDAREQGGARHFVRRILYYGWMLRLVTVPIVSLVILLGACGEESALHVAIRTDFVAGVDFDSVEVLVGDGPDALRLTYPVQATEDFIGGVRVGAFGGLPAATHRLSARLLRGGALVIERAVSLTYDAGLAVATIVITRSCLGVTCATGAPSCLGGMCVDERCTEETPEFCPTDCECSPSACEEAICASGACLYRSMCPAGESCTGGMCSELCPTGSWTAGSPVFRDATTEWGLDGIPGSRINVVDVDGDGWSDVLVRGTGRVAENFSDGGSRDFFLFRSDGSRFTDITASSGILQLRGSLDSAQGRSVVVVAFADVNNDGLVDAYTGSSTEPGVGLAGQRSEIMLGNGDGTFRLAPTSPVSASVDSPGGASFLDFDRDGNLDLFVGQYYFDDGGGRVAQADRLYQGDGAGGFVDVTVAAGTSSVAWSDLAAADQGLAHSIAWGTLARDVDADGWPDILVASYGRAPNHFWRNRNGTFVSESVTSGYAFDHRVDWRDNWAAQCFCQFNPGWPDCVGVGAPPPIMCPPWDPNVSVRPSYLGGFSGTSSPADLDNDGDLDLFTSEIWNAYTGSSGDKSEILVNEGNAVFSRPGPEITGAIAAPTAMPQEQTHLTNATLDFDNDGRVDLLLCALKNDEPSALLRQDAVLSFSQLSGGDAALPSGLTGVGVADFDRDGDLDVIVGSSRGAEVRFLENITPPASFVQVLVEPGPGSNGFAVGAQVSVETPAGLLMQEVGGGHGHNGGQHDRALHFGLGGACEARVDVRWPDSGGTSATFVLTAGRRYVVSPSGFIIDRP